MDNFEREFYDDFKVGMAKFLIVDDFIFLSGMSASNGSSDAAIPDTIKEQIRAVAENLHRTFKLAAWTEEPLTRMVKFTIYVKKGAAPPHYVMRQFIEACQELAPKLIDYPSTGTCVVVEQLEHEEHLLVVDAIGAIAEGTD
ncbi:MAG: hypothetical protein LBR44_09490 [Clostridiales Family XIII bacterium]|jgi:enamine deaminase RidA (YjgF/YER057c/UK114 family)|nr:hypothetical protein [Clostridiales Family XIII bacterium]